MRVCEKEHAAVQFACLSALSLAPRLVVGPVAGLAAERLGFAPFFAATAVLALPALALLPAVRKLAADER
jgi:PAT family beta-lactamase induction signal transducer AmpG